MMLCCAVLCCGVVWRAGVLERSSFMPAEYRARTKQLFAQYYPKEISSTISFADKVKAMEEWCVSLVLAVCCAVLCCAVMCCAVL